MSNPIPERKRRRDHPLDIDDVRDMLSEMSKPTSDSALAKQLGLSAQYLCDVLLGRREPGPKMLQALGLRKEVRYVKEQPNA